MTDHAYISTACHHATHDPGLTDEVRRRLHSQCRRVCKYGGEACACVACDHTELHDRAGRELWRGASEPVVTGDHMASVLSRITVTVDVPPGTELILYAAQPAVCEPCVRGVHVDCDGGCRCEDNGHYNLAAEAGGA